MHTTYLYKIILYRKINICTSMYIYNLYTMYISHVTCKHRKRTREWWRGEIFHCYRQLLFCLYVRLSVHFPSLCMLCFILSWVGCAWPFSSIYLLRTFWIGLLSLFLSLDSLYVLVCIQSKSS